MHIVSVQQENSVALQKPLDVCNAGGNNANIVMLIANGEYNNDGDCSDSDSKNQGFGVRTQIMWLQDF